MMGRRSFLGKVVVTIAALLLPQRVACAELESSTEEYALGLGKPCPDKAWLEGELVFPFTPDGGYTRENIVIPWTEADIEFERRMRVISSRMAQAAIETLDAQVSEMLENA